MSQLIEVLVSPTGQTQVQTRGFTGASCRQVSEYLETALGQRQREELTAEFHQAATEETAVRTSH